MTSHSNHSGHQANPETAKTKKNAGTNQKKERLAKALRDNILRRKASSVTTKPNK